MSSEDTEEGGRHERDGRKTNMFSHIFREVIYKDSTTSVRIHHTHEPIQCMCFQSYENQRNQSVKTNTEVKLNICKNTSLKLLKKTNNPLSLIQSNHKTAMCPVTKTFSLFLQCAYSFKKTEYVYCVCVLIKRNYSACLVCRISIKKNCHCI